MKLSWHLKLSKDFASVGVADLPNGRKMHRGWQRKLDQQHRQRIRSRRLWTVNQALFRFARGASLAVLMKVIIDYHTADSLPANEHILLTALDFWGNLLHETAGFWKYFCFTVLTYCFSSGPLFFFFICVPSCNLCAGQRSICNKLMGLLVSSWILHVSATALIS